MPEKAERPEQESENLRKDPLENFTSQERATIGERRHMLSSLAHFVGKNFSVPVEIGDPGSGWEGDVQGTKIIADPNDLVNESLDSLRYKVATQSGRLRISRLGDIPKDQWEKPGYQYLTNVLEGARSTNFVAEGYPKISEHLEEAERAGKIVESKTTATAHEQLGFIPRFIQAGNELTRKWYSEIRETPGQPPETLSEDVSRAMTKIEKGAHDTWWKYPTKKEADQSGDVIKKYARGARETIDSQVWPEFEELIKKDLEDAGVSEMLNDMMEDSKSQQGSEQPIPQDVAEKLTEEQLQQLVEAMEKAMSENERQETSEEENTTTPIDLESLSEELKQKLREHLKSLPAHKQEELRQRAGEKMKILESDINREIKGMMDENPDEMRNAPKDDSESQAKGGNGTEGNAKQNDENTGKKSQEEIDKETKRFKQKILEIFGTDETKYERIRTDLMPIIDKLENDLRELFSKRRESHLQTGYKTGRRVDIPKRIQEKVRGVSVMESKAWQRRKLPLEKDYAFTLLVDVTTSMLEDDKILETFKGVVVLTEVLNRLSINLEVVAYNTDMFVFQEFGQKMSDDIRVKMEDMLEIPIRSQRNRKWGTATGWAVNQSSDRLARQVQKEKVMIVLSDGRPDLPSDSPRRAFDLKTEIEKAKAGRNQKVIGGGIGPGTGFMKEYFENYFIASNVQQIPDELANAIRKIVGSYV